MNELDITETDLGLFLDCQKWCILMLSKYLKVMQIKEQKDTVINPQVTVVATVDYAKGAKMTVCGLQLCHPNINQDSSNNYHVNCVYIGAESGHHLKQNCSNLISFLASFCGNYDLGTRTMMQNSIYTLLNTFGKLKNFVWTTIYQQ
jgi:hypothetical protein